MRPSNPQMLILGNPGKKRAPFHYPKGSPEAREYMARLRAMRGKKNPLTDREASSQMHRGSLAMKIGQKYHAQGMGAHAIHAAAHAQGLYEGVEVTAKSPFMRQQASDQAAASYQSAGEWWPKGGYHLTGQVRGMNPSVTLPQWAGRRDLYVIKAGSQYLSFFDDNNVMRPRLTNQFRLAWPMSEYEVEVIYGKHRDGILKGKDPLIVPVSSLFHRKTNPTLTPFQCPMCGGTLMQLGRLGKMNHYRCEQCGMDTSKKAGSRFGGEHCTKCGTRLRSGEGFQGMCPFCVREGNPLNRREGGGILRVARRAFDLAARTPSKEQSQLWRGIGLGETRVAEVYGVRSVRRAAERLISREPKMKYRSMNPDMRGIPPWMANDPAFRQELAAYTKRHGRGPVRITQVKVPTGYPKYMSVYGKAPEIKYDAPAHSNKGRRIHKFGEGGGRPPWLATSVSRGPKFLSFVGGTFKAKDWIYK